MQKRKKNPHQLDLLKSIVSLSPQKQSHVIRFLNDDAVDLISECVKNVIFRNLGLNRKEKQKLKTKIAGKESILRFISKKSNRTSSRKKKLLQTGGFIGNQVFQNFIFSNEKST